MRIIRGLSHIKTLPDPVLIISHGGVYWVLQEILRLPVEDLPNCVPVYHKPPEKKSEPWFACALDED